MGSSGTTTTRLFITSTSTTCAALLEGTLHDVVLAALHMIGEVAGRLVPQRGRAGHEGCASIDDGGQRLVVDLDQFGGFAGDIGIVGNDERHRIADMAYAPLGQRRPGRHDQGFTAAMQGRCPRPSAARSAAVAISCTPASAEA